MKPLYGTILKLVFASRMAAKQSRDFLMIIVLFFTLGLSACTNLQNNHKDASPQVLKQYSLQQLAVCACENHCKARFAACSRVCSDSLASCKQNNINKANAANWNYTMRQRIEGKILAREKNSFGDPLACIKISCNCKQDFKNCMVTCGRKRSLVMQN